MYPISSSSSSTRLDSDVGLLGSAIADGSTSKARMSRIASELLLLPRRTPRSSLMGTSVIVTLVVCWVVFCSQSIFSCASAVVASPFRCGSRRFKIFVQYSRSNSHVC